MPEAVISWVNALAADQPQLLTFYDRNKTEISDVDNAAAFPEPTNTTDYKIPGVIGDDAQIPGVETDNPKELVETKDMNETITPTPEAEQAEPDPIQLIEENATNFEPYATGDMEVQDMQATPMPDAINIEQTQPPIEEQQPRRSTWVRKQTKA